MRSEAELFWGAFLWGTLWMLALWLVNAIRKYRIHAGVVKAVLDLGFWILTGILGFCEIYRYNQGILRGFLFLGCICGGFSMNFLLKRLLFRIKRCNILMSKIVESGFFVKKKNFLIFKRSKRIEKVKKKKREKQNCK